MQKWQTVQPCKRLIYTLSFWTLEVVKVNSTKGVVGVVLNCSIAHDNYDEIANEMHC
jgi:hypothetical protein